MRMAFVFLGAAALLFARSAFASEIYPFFRDVRAQGMGGAGVAVVDDHTALLINPAGLGKIRGPYVSLVNPQLEINYDLNAAMGTNGGYSQVLSAQGLLTVAKTSPEKHLHMGGNVLPAFATTNFAIGLLYETRADGEYTAATDTFHLDYVNDAGAVLGYCFRLWEGRIKIGVSGKVINRVYVNQDIPGSSTGLTLQSLASEGDGVGWDGGVLLTAPWAWLPTIGATAHDIGRTYFTMGNGYFYKTGTIPPPQEQSIDAAIAVFPIHSNSIRSSFTVEYRDVQNPETLDMFRRIHAGWELNMADTLFLRAGMNQRYYTAGLEWDFAHNQIQAATYGEEIGTATANREDRRFVIEYSFRF